MLILPVLDFTKSPLICMYLDTAVEKRNRPPLEGGRRREPEAMRHNAHTHTSSFDFWVCLLRALARLPLHTAALAFVSFGIVLFKFKLVKFVQPADE